MDLGATLAAFVAVFPAELPDKTMVATLVLVARYRHPFAVWVGAAAAFTVHVVVAVVAGGLLGLLPDAVVSIATAVLFAAGAVVLWRSAARSSEGADGDGIEAEPVPASFREAALGSFGVVLVAEWGDLTQIATASLAASTGEPVAVAIGALLALWSVAALAVTAGRLLTERLPVATLQRVAAGVFAALAVLSLAELVA